MAHGEVNYLLLLYGDKCSGEKYGLGRREGKAHKKEGNEHLMTTREWVFYVSHFS